MYTCVRVCFYVRAQLKGKKKKIKKKYRWGNYDNDDSRGKWMLINNLNGKKIDLRCCRVRYCSFSIINLMSLRYFFFFLYFIS